MTDSSPDYSVILCGMFHVSTDWQQGPLSVCLCSALGAAQAEALGAHHLRCLLSQPLTIRQHILGLLSSGRTIPPTVPSPRAAIISSRRAGGFPGHWDITAASRGRKAQWHEQGRGVCAGKRGRDQELYYEDNADSIATASSVLSTPFP